MVNVRLPEPLTSSIDSYAGHKGLTRAAAIRNILEEHMSTLSTYTVVIQASDADGDIWQALHPAETITTADSAEQVARDVAQNQNLAEGTGWRVRVWLGDDTDTATEPAAEYHAAVDLAELTARLGLDAHQQQAVQSWTGEPAGTVWTEEEVAELIEIWQVDQERIAAETA